MASDSPRPIKGDVIHESIRRVKGRCGQDDGLIEIALVSHAHSYQARIERGSGAPRLVELHLISDINTEIDPATIRQAPVRRLAKAAARFISRVDGAIVTPDELDDPTLLLGPERPPDGGRRRKLDDVHYRQVSHLLIAARENGFAPREYVAEHLRGSLPTVDRWIAEAKRRRILPRDWNTTTEETDPQPHFTPTTKETRR
ncbi:MAG TPA: hypothetical protein VGI68_19200 [Mycobacterium sp.]